MNEKSVEEEDAHISQELESLGVLQSTCCIGGTQRERHHIFSEGNKRSLIRALFAEDFESLLRHSKIDAVHKSTFRIDCIQTTLELSQRCRFHACKQTHLRI